jgi:putative spermidine/putrescine transport system substrate-binding protein
MKTRQALALMVSLAAVALCWSGAWAGQPAGEITLMSYGGIVEDMYKAAVVQPFMKKFPGVTVKYFAGGSSAQMLGTLRAQRSSPQIDVAIMDTSVSDVGNKEGVLAKPDPAQVPSLTELFPQALVPGGFGPAVTFDHWVVVYDTDKVKPAPTRFADLWNPQLKRQISLPAMPNIQGIAATILTAKMLGQDYRQSIEAAVQKLKELAPAVQTFDPQPDGYTLVLGGSLSLATGWNARAQLFHDQSKGKMGVLLPAEGSVFQINTINLVAGSKNPGAAQAFINYALSADAQKAFTETMFYAPTNAKAKIAPAAAARVAGTPETMAKMIPVDWNWIATIRDQWNNRWRREIIPAGSR